MRRWIMLGMLFIGLLPSTGNAQDSVARLVIDTSDGESNHTVYRVNTNGEREWITQSSQRLTASDLIDNRWLTIGSSEHVWDVSAAIPTLHPDSILTQPPDVREADLAALPFQPLLAPQALHWLYPNSAPENHIIYGISGERNTLVDFYTYATDEWVRLTDVVAHFPEAIEPIQGGSVFLVDYHPQQVGFLYRARLLDAEGETFNALYFYDFEQRQSIDMPYFGKNPVWSPDGAHLLGARLDEDHQPPIYKLWMVDVETWDATFIDQGCNPAWSSDGNWIAYDGHDNSISESYIDCFANGEVWIRNLGTDEISLVGGGDGEFATVIGWVEVLD